MTRREKYTALFPAPIARRLIEQFADEYLDERIEGRDAEGLLSEFWLSWDNMQEGFLFWCALDTLYAQGESPTEEDVMAIFEIHDIPYE